MGGEIKDKEYPISVNWEVEQAGIYLAVNFIGLIDEFALFNRALTPEEIALLRSRPNILSALKKQ